METNIWILLDKTDDVIALKKKLPCLFNNTRLVKFNSYEKLLKTINSYSFSDNVQPIIFTEKFFTNIEVFINKFISHLKELGGEVRIKPTTIDCGCKMKLIEFYFVNEYKITGIDIISFEEMNELSGFKSEKLKSFNFNEREQDFLKYSIKGKNIDYVASMMNLSVKGAEYYRKSVYEKVGVKNKSELMFFAVKYGIL